MLAVSTFGTHTLSKYKSGTIFACKMHYDQFTTLHNVYTLLHTCLDLSGTWKIIIMMFINSSCIPTRSTYTLNSLQSVNFISRNLNGQFLSNTCLRSMVVWHWLRNIYVWFLQSMWGRNSIFSKHIVGWSIFWSQKIRLLHIGFSNFGSLWTFNVIEKTFFFWTHMANHTALKM